MHEGQPNPVKDAAEAGDAQGRQRNRALDGIRGFAALAVLLAHFAVAMGLLPYAPLGFMGVIMFFALSGYLIGGICWRMASTWQAYRVFIGRRVRRLAPVLVALAVVGGPLFVVLGGAPPSQVARDSLVALSQTTAFARAMGVDTLEPYRPTWSLTVEWAFYLSFPLVLMALRRRTDLDAARATVALAVVATCLYLAGLGLPPVEFYHLPVANLAVLFAGAALATWHLGTDASGGRHAVDPARTGMALVMLSILVFLPGPTSGWGWKLAVVPASALCTLALIHGSWAGNRVSGWLGAGPLRWVGLRAYSLYIWHLPIMWLVWVTMPGSTRHVRAGVALAIIFVTVVVSFELLERPVMRSRGRGGHQPRRDQAVTPPSSNVRTHS